MSDQPIPANRFRSPYTKVPGRRGVRALYRPDSFPTPHYRLSPEQLDSPQWPIHPRPAGLAQEWELQRPKVRGLSPSDSLILKLAINEGMFHPDRTHLGALIPYEDPTVPWHEIEVSRNLLECGTAPTQCDLILDRRPMPHYETDTPFDDAFRRVAGPRIDVKRNPLAGPAPPVPAPPASPGFPVLIVEIKPNAGYVAFGQVLAYLWNWSRFYADRWPARAAILTDLPKPYLPALAAAYDVGILSLNTLVIEPPNYPT